MEERNFKMFYKNHKKLINQIIWIIFNSTLFIATFYWLIKGNTYAANYVRFIVYLHFFISLIVFDNETKNRIKEKGYNIHPNLNFFIDFCLSIILVISGHWWFGLIYIIGGKLQQEIYM